MIIQLIIIYPSERYSFEIKNTAHILQFISMGENVLYIWYCRETVVVVCFFVLRCWGLVSPLDYIWCQLYNSFDLIIIFETWKKANCNINFVYDRFWCFWFCLPEHFLFRYMLISTVLFKTLLVAPDEFQSEVAF